MSQNRMENVVIFSPTQHSMLYSLSQSLNAEVGETEYRLFPDGESYLRVLSEVKGKQCAILVDLTYPDTKFLPLIFLADTLKDIGATSVGLIAPYLSYMRQDKRFNSGEAVTSSIFARSISLHFDWLVTVDPHLHRYDSLDEIYDIPTSVVQAAPAIAKWVELQPEALLVGPDSESEQWVAEIAKYSKHDYIIGEKNRKGDRQVKVTLAGLDCSPDTKVIIIDDVISSGHTVLQCFNELKQRGMQNISCATVHGVFADESDSMLIMSGISEIVSCNTVAHHSNQIDVTPFVTEAVLTHLR